MAEEPQIVELRTDFYTDSFGKVIFVILGLLLAIAALVALAVYLHIHKPEPVAFNVGDEWRIQDAVPLDKPYLSDSELLQWVSNVFLTVFTFDFVHYNDQLSVYQTYFTDNGWGVFLNHLNTYANYNNVQMYRMFITSAPTGAPYIINQNLLNGRYAWWVQLPIRIKYSGYHPTPSMALTLQVLVTRVSTMNNLAGVGIDNVIVTQNKTNPPAGSL